MRRIELNRAKATEIKKPRRLAACAAWPKADISATPEEIGPVSNIRHNGGTSDFRRKFRFGSVSAAVAVAHTNNRA